MFALIFLRQQAAALRSILNQTEIQEAHISLMPFKRTQASCTHRTCPVKALFDELPRKSMMEDDFKNDPLLHLQTVHLPKTGRDHQHGQQVRSSHMAMSMAPNSIEVRVAAVHLYMFGNY